MTVDDRTRLQLHRRLEEVLGADEANTLMEHLPPVGWRDVATKQDLGVLRTDLTAEIGGLRSDLTAEIAGLRSDVRLEIAGLRSDVRLEIADLRIEMHRGFGRQAWFMVALMTAQTGLLGVIFALAA
jgi:hypothetical protein